MSVDRLVMCGCHEAGTWLIPSLIEAGFRFQHFVSLTPDQGKKYQVSGYADFQPMAAKYGIPVYVPRTYSLDAPEDIAFFERHKFRLLIQGGWQRLFPNAVLSSLELGAVGVHGSSDFLPKGRGRSPLNWSLIEARCRFLMHLFLMASGADDGDVFDVEDFDINPFDDIETLYFKNAIVTRRMMLRSIPKLLAGELIPWKQSGEPTYYPKRSPDDGRIDWEKMDFMEIYHFVRAQTRPYPGAFGMVDGKAIRFWRVRPFDTRITYPQTGYGCVVERFGNRFIINCRGGLLLADDWETITSMEKS